MIPLAQARKLVHDQFYRQTLDRAIENLADEVKSRGSHVVRLVGAAGPPYPGVGLAVDSLADPTLWAWVDDGTGPGGHRTFCQAQLSLQSNLSERSGYETYDAQTIRDVNLAAVRPGDLIWVPVGSGNRIRMEQAKVEVIEANGSVRVEYTGEVRAESGGSRYWPYPVGRRGLIRRVSTLVKAV